MSKSGAKYTKGARNFQLTINEFDLLSDLLSYLRGLKPNYIIANKESAPTTGHIHSHIYVQFPNSRRLPISKLYGAHVEKCLGSPKQNIEYVKKDNAEIIVEEGSPRFNHVPSISNVKNMDKKERDQLPVMLYNIVKKINAEEDADLIPSQCYKEVNVEWYWGESGAGKTRAAMKAIGERKFNMVKFENGFWHGIGTAEVALYDDFRDSHMKPTELINFIDYYIHPMNIKGDTHKNTYKEIYITSIQDPEKIYSNMPEEYKKQWLRRIKKIVKYELINN